jgi:hypothetical protein
VTDDLDKLYLKLTPTKAKSAKKKTSTKRLAA